MPFLSRAWTVLSRLSVSVSSRVARRESWPTIVVAYPPDSGKAGANTIYWGYQGPRITMVSPSAKSHISMPDMSHTMTLRSDNAPGTSNAAWLLMAGPIAVGLSPGGDVWLAVNPVMTAWLRRLLQTGLAVNRRYSAIIRQTGRCLETDVMRSGQRCACSFAPRKVRGAAGPGAQTGPPDARRAESNGALVEEGQGFYSGNWLEKWPGAGLCRLRIRLGNGVFMVNGWRIQLNRCV